MQAVIEQMNQLEVSMGAEIKPASEIQHAIERRLIQVQGDLLEYNPLQDDNILRAKDVFLCVDKLAGRPQGYMLNIVDGTQRTSYTRKELVNVADIEISADGVNFIGEPRKNGFIPGYTFRVKVGSSDFTSLKSVLVKCLYEVNSAKGKAAAGRKDAEDYDEAYFLGLN
jgi:hypothetical protein